MKKVREKCHTCGRYTHGEFTISITATDGSKFSIEFCTRKHLREKVVAIVTERA